MFEMSNIANGVPKLYGVVFTGIIMIGRLNWWTWSILGQPLVALNNHAGKENNKSCHKINPQTNGRAKI